MYLPTIIFAHPKNQIKESHAWNIDGYMSKERNVTTKEYQGNVLMGETVERIACNMVHCDMGWGGIYNGYYITGVFQLNHSDAELDELYTNAIKTTNYNSYIKVLKYDLPTRQ